MTNVRKSFFYSISSRYASILIQLISITVISRVLTPKEIGIYSITASLFGFLLLIRDFGIGSYLIQEKELSKEKIASSFSLSILLCWFLALFVYLVKAEVSDFYDIKGMETIFEFLIINLLIIPFGSITLSLLKRNMEYKKVMIISISSSMASTFISISSALLGMSYLSLVYGSVAGTLATVVVASFFRYKETPWLPGFHGLKEVASFGWKVSGSNVFGQVSISSPDLILGKIQGPVEVVFFNKALSVLKLFEQLFFNSIYSVFQSYLAQENRNNRGVKTPFLIGSGYYLIFSWSFVAFLLFNSKGLILILFGDQWLGVSPLIQVMLIGFAITSVTRFYQMTMLSLGKPGKLLKLAMYMSIAQVTILLSYGLFDLVYIALALLVMPILRILLIKKNISLFFGVTFKDIMDICKIPFIFFIFIALLNIVLTMILPFDSLSIVDFFRNMLITFMIWLIILWFSNHPLKYEFTKIYNKLSGKQ